MQNSQGSDAVLSPFACLLESDAACTLYTLYTMVSHAVVIFTLQYAYYDLLVTACTI
jgi:hypothetical protein